MFRNNMPTLTENQLSRKGANKSQEAYERLTALAQKLGPSAKLPKVTELRRDLQVSPFGDAGEVCVPWDRADLRPAVEFAVVYYKLLAGLGFFEEYRWHRRPAPASRPAGGSVGPGN